MTEGNPFGIRQMAMKTNPSSRFQALWAGIVLLCLSAAPLCADTFGDFTYTDDGTSITITDYPTTNTGDVVIPDTIIGKPVTSIGQSAFRDCSALTSVTIPAGVTSIGDGAFHNCSALTSVTISEGVTSIGHSAFYNCSALTSVTISEGLTSIGESAFSNCSALTSVTIPSSVTSIGYSAFRDCSALTSVTIPSSVTSIGLGAFYNCNSLTSVTISEGVTSIGQFAFFNCSALTSVTIPEGVTSIGDVAFYNCSALTMAVFLGDAPSLGSGVFGNTAAGFTIHYLSGSTGFTTPTWEGYLALPPLDASETWLLGHGYPHTANLHQDTTGDGVSLLMAYALNLNPNLNLAGSLPAPVLGGNTLSMSFHAASPGITYSVETSIDLNTWVTEGVTMSGPDNQRTASVAMDFPQRFLRLVVQQ